MTRSLIFLLLFVSHSCLSNDIQKTSNKSLNLYFQTQVDYEAFFNELRNSLLANEREKVASLNLYPIQVNYPTDSVAYESPEVFLENYDRIVTSEMLQRVREQKFDSLFYNYNGMHIGLGDIWFYPTCFDGESCEKVEIKVWVYSVLSVKGE